MLTSNIPFHTRISQGLDTGVCEQPVLLLLLTIMCYCLLLCVTAYRYVLLEATHRWNRNDDTGVCEKKYLFYLGLGHATQQQKLLSSPRFGAFRADFPTCLLIRRSVFSQTPVNLKRTLRCDLEEWVESDLRPFTLNITVGSLRMLGSAFNTLMFVFLTLTT